MSDARRVWLVLLAVPFVISALTYARVPFNPYAYDAGIFLNGAIPNFTMEALWTPTVYHDQTSVLSWRPLTILMHWGIDGRLFASQAPLSHLLNVALHGLNAGLIALLAHRLMRRENANGPLVGPLVAGSLFAAHPINSEVVSCMGFRADSAALCALLGALLMASGGGRIAVRAAGVFLLTLVAAGFKEFGCLALFVVPLLLWSLARSARETAVLTLAPLAAVALFLVPWLQFRYPNYAAGYLGGEGRLLGVANFMVAFFEIYLPGMVFPLILRIDHEFVAIASLGDARFIRALVVTALLIFALGYFALRNRAALFSLLWIPIAFAPLAQLTPVPDPIAERFATVPMVGIALLVSVLALWERRSLQIVAVVLVLLLGTRTFIRTGDWTSDVTLNRRNWEDSPEPTAKSTLFLSALHLKEQNRPGARLRIQEHLLLAPDSVEGHRILAIIQFTDGDTSAALTALQRARSLDPEDPLVRQTFTQLFPESKPEN